MTQRFVLHAGDDSRARILANLWTFLSGLAQERSWVIEIKRYVKERSSDQNRALWGVAYPPIVAATGQEAADWHEYFLGEWFGWVETRMFGRRKVRPARTTTTDFSGADAKLSTAEFAQFYDFIQRRAGENGIFVPDPDPLWRERQEVA